MDPARCVVEPGAPRIECAWCAHSVPVSSVNVLGTPEAVAEWSRVRPRLAELTGDDPTGADGSGLDAYERWVSERKSQSACGGQEGAEAPSPAAPAVAVRPYSVERVPVAPETVESGSVFGCRPARGPAFGVAATAPAGAAQAAGGSVFGTRPTTTACPARGRQSVFGAAAAPLSIAAQVTTGTGCGVPDSCMTPQPAPAVYGEATTGESDTDLGGAAIASETDAEGAVGDRSDDQRRRSGACSPDGQRLTHGIAAGAPGPLQEMIDPDTGAIVRGRARQRKARKVPTLPVVYEGDPDGPLDQGAGVQGGQLQGIAAKVLMKILYAARMARTDLLRAVCHLACYITRWDSACDRRLHRLVAYIASTTDHKLMGWVGDEQPQLQPHLYADADFAGCVATQRSTSGAYLCICGPHTCFPIAANSKRQGCVSKSTPEAEIISMDFAIRSMGLPSLSLWDTLGFGKGGVDVHEDNMSMVRICETGRNPTMRYLSRTHGVSVAWLHEQFTGGTLRLHYERSDRMRADLLTKAFTDLARWEAACWLINVLHPDRLQEVIELGDRPPPQLGGGRRRESGTPTPMAAGAGAALTTVASGTGTYMLVARSEPKSPAESPPT